MPLLLADLIYSRDCKLNLRKNVDTTLRFHGSKQDFQIFLALLQRVAIDVLGVMLPVRSSGRIRPSR